MNIREKLSIKNKDSKRIFIVLGVSVILVVVISIILVSSFHEEKIERGKLLNHAFIPPDAPRKEVTLYFSNRGGTGLSGEKRDVIAGEDPAILAASIVEALFRGPTGELVAMLPQELKVHTVFLDRSGVAYIEFDASLSSLLGGGTWKEVLTVYSLVNSLVLNVEEISSVQILMDGAEAETLAGHVDCRRPFSAKTELIIDKEEYIRENGEDRSSDNLPAIGIME